ncbi:siphovirus Gp157 family protein [Chitinophaga sp. sic0106]|uniref:siphovirus Gp157 family protein n=1 Tax=Chitinophaga sp. sic0106 TaxID=2854785 RepID=UPI001C4673C5|nr:siphovirus Gp157 family protein [Chitinophaga sp. sic0106]MBV7534075.1 siphovirus Gp157 family protein [Chitinophaga sp. sic0106]
MGQSKEIFAEERNESKRSLYDIRQDNLTLLAFIDAADGELDEAAMEELTINREEFQQKAIAYGFAIRKLEADAEVVAQEIKRLQAREAAFLKKAKKLEQIVLEAMTEFGEVKVQNELLTLSIRKSSPVELSETCHDDIIRYCSVTAFITPGKEDEAIAAGVTSEVLATLNIKSTISKTRVASLIKEGITYPGAAIVERKSLQIR